MDGGHQRHVAPVDSLAITQALAGRGVLASPQLLSSQFCPFASPCFPPLARQSRPLPSLPPLFTQVVSTVSGSPVSRGLGTAPLRAPGSAFPLLLQRRPPCLSCLSHMWLQSVCGRSPGAGRGAVAGSISDSGRVSFETIETLLEAWPFKHH